MTKKVLIIDDDSKNIFALSATLKAKGIVTASATNAADGIQLLHEDESITVILMDMMMPEMDGYDAIRQIRKRAQWKNLPVIAVTAKAMTGDREKCIEAGASDYISKPVDTDQLISLLRIWLYENDYRQNHA